MQSNVDITMQSTIARLIQDVNQFLVGFLEKELSGLYDDWWSKGVISGLSYEQRRRAEQNGSQSLRTLDLAALLRILDHNWYQISNKLSLTPESRHFIKEMQTIRNRWAHASTDGFTIDDAYRDLDTLQRFAIVIKAGERFIQDVQSCKSEILAKAATPIKLTETNREQTLENNKRPITEYQLGQIVIFRSDQSVRGAVVSVIPGKPENRYKVFTNGETQTFYESQLQAINDINDSLETLSCEQFHAYLTALQIRYPGLSTLYSLNAARIDFIPYQFRPVLKFIRSERPRLLIADGVGVGKTIEAGLILRELQARREVRSVLIVCPRPLVTERKWMREMKRFEERFTHLDGNTLRFCINEMDLEGAWPEQHLKTIIPYSLFDETLLYGTEKERKRKRKKGLLDLDPPPRFDLVIVDEAHHIRNQDTYSNKAVRFFCDHAEAVVFLTATPIQLGSNDLFVLLNTLRPDLIIDQKSFTHMAEPNPFINQAVNYTRSNESDWQSKTHTALEHAAETAWGEAILRRNPDFIRISSRLIEGNVTDEERVQFISDMEAMHTFSGVINRTRRRDIGEFTIRKPETVIVPFTPTQQLLHDRLIEVQSEIFIKLHGDNNVKFLMTTIRRQAASCIFGLAPLLKEILTRHLDELPWSEIDNSNDIPSEETIESIQSQIQSILESARLLEADDPKLDALRSIIQNKQKLSNNKVILFSSFRHTLNYLYHHLSKAGIRVGLIHGNTPDEDRVVLRSRFELQRDNSDCLDVLLFSEIGCEGLDYQFCDCIVNYDLPWNPMRVEQRIGRIDRNGQKSESVAIINMITPGTVDADIYDRCLVRIGVFNSALGGSEEILGEITREIKDIAESYNLSDEDRRSKLQQLADNNIRLVQAQVELEQRQLELFGIQLPEEQMKKDIADASSFWLSPVSIFRIVNLYLQNTIGKEQEFILGEKPLKTLRLSQDARNILLRDFQQLPKQNLSAYREWENWLKGGNPHLSVTFEADCALEFPETTFIMPLHPLVKQAAKSFDLSKRAFVTLSANTRDIPAGQYEFAIYQWRYHGIKEDLILRPVGSSDLVTTHLSSLLETTVDLTSIVSNKPSCDALDIQHYKLWTEARTKHRNKTQQMAEFRRESLTTSHRARVSLLKEQLEQASNDKIRRMRDSQISAAEADYARRIQELDIALEKADITAEAVAYGALRVIREST